MDPPQQEPQKPYFPYIPDKKSITRNTKQFLEVEGGMPPISRDQLGFSNMIIKSKMTLRNRQDNMTSLGEKKEKMKRARNLSMLDQYDDIMSGRSSRMVD